MVATPRGERGTVQEDRLALLLMSVTHWMLPKAGDHEVEVEAELACGGGSREVTSLSSVEVEVVRVSLYPKVEALHLLIILLAIEDAHEARDMEGVMKRGIDMTCNALAMLTRYFYDRMMLRLGIIAIFFKVRFFLIFLLIGNGKVGI